MKYLVAFEAVNLDDLIGDCQDLSTTRGGGLAVLEIGKVACALDPNPIVAQASKGLIEIEAASADNAERLVRREIEKIPILRYATVMVAACEEGPDFAVRYHQLLTRMRWQQMRSPSVVYPKLHGQDVCKIDKVRPGIPVSDREGVQVQSDFTAARRRRGRDEKTGLPGRILTNIDFDFELFEDLNKLADDEDSFGNAGDKIAVLHFDGNDFGKQAGAAAERGKDSLREFGKRISHRQEEFFRALVDKKERSIWFKDGSRLRLEILLYGGDEVTFITPAWLGWRALRKFYEQAEAWNDPKYSFGGGMVICHRNAPIHAIRELASELSNRAKKKPKGNYAACQVLESYDAIGRDLDIFMEERYKYLGGVEKARLGRREIDLIGDNIDHWRANVSKRHLHRLVLALQDGETVEPDAAIRDLTESRQGPENAGQSLRDLYNLLGNAAFLHILELWDYVEVGE